MYRKQMYYILSLIISKITHFKFYTVYTVHYDTHNYYSSDSFQGFIKVKTLHM